MTFNQEYKSSRRDFWFYAIAGSTMVGSKISLIKTGSMKATDWLLLVVGIYVVGKAIQYYFKMKKAKRYIVFDDFLETIKQN